MYRAFLLYIVYTFFYGFPDFPNAFRYDFPFALHNLYIMSGLVSHGETLCFAHGNKRKHVELQNEKPLNRHQTII